MFSISINLRNHFPFSQQKTKKPGVAQDLFFYSTVCSCFNERYILVLNGRDQVVTQPTGACPPFVRHRLGAMAYQALQKLAPDP